MRRQWTALLLTVTLALTLCAIPALAQTEQEAPPAQAAEQDPAPAEPEGSGEEGEPPAKAGDVPAEEEAELSRSEARPIVVQPDGTAASSTMDDELVFTGEDDFRYLAFEDLRDRVLEGSLTAKMLEESIASIDAMDYTQMYLDLSTQLTGLEAAQQMYAQIPVATPMEGAMQGYVISNLASSFGAITSTMSDLTTGKLQRDSAAAKRQLKNAQDQMVVGAESLYFAILELEQT